MHTRTIEIDDITVNQRHRNIDDSEAGKLATSMAQTGQLTPIIVRRVDDDDNYHLTAGHHRLVAAQKLDWTSIDARIMPEETDSMVAEMAEIDENLFRYALTPSQETQHMTRRRDIWNALNPEETGGEANESEGQDEGQDEPGDSTPQPEGATAGQVASEEADEATQQPAHEEPKSNKPGPDKQFSGVTAEATGRSQRDINRAVRRGDSICQQAMDLIQQTELDKGVFMDELIAQNLDEEGQVRYVKDALDKKKNEHTDEAKQQKREEKKARKQAEEDALALIRDKLSGHDRDQLRQYLAKAGGKLTLKADQLKDWAAPDAGQTDDLPGLDHDDTSAEPSEQSDTDLSPDVDEVNGGEKEEPETAVEGSGSMSSIRPDADEASSEAEQSRDLDGDNGDDLGFDEDDAGQTPPPAWQDDHRQLADSAVDDYGE